MNKLYRILTFVFLCCIATWSSAQCNIENLRIETDGCNSDGSFVVNLLFEDTNQSMKQYIVQGNGADYGTFDYDNGIIIKDLVGDCSTPYEFVVRDAADPSCGAFIDLGILCCGPFCNIDIELKELSDCRGGAEFDVVFDVISFPPNSLGYDIFQNNIQIGFVDINSANQQITMDWDGSDEYTLVLCDNDNQTCCDTITFVPPCVCNIFDAQWDIIDCDPSDSTFNFILNANYQSVSDSFTVGGNSTNYGNYAYSQLPIVLGPFKYGTGQKFDFLLADLNNLFCFDFVEPLTIDKCPPTCSMDAIVEQGLCNEDNTVSFFLTAGGDRTGVLGYEVSYNGSIIDTFSYSNINYEVGPFPSDCNDMHSFTFTDLYHPDCDTTITLDPFCCDPTCEIDDLFVEVNCEGNGDPGFFLNFNHNLAANEAFVLLIDDQPYGNYTINDLPIMDNAFVFSDGLHRFVVEARDSMCIEDFSVNVECFVPCDFGDIFVSIGDCDADMMVVISYTFDAFQSPSDSFDLIINGVLTERFAYNQNYQITVAADCQTIYELDIVDSQNPDCSTSTIIGDPICCAMPCEVDILNVETGDCNNDLNVPVAIIIASNDAASDSFTLRGNGVVYGTFAYTDSPIQLNVPGDCQTTYEFIAIDQGDANCQDEFVLSDTLCCMVDPCVINIAEVLIGECNADMLIPVVLRVEGNSEASDSIDIAGNGQQYGRFAISDSIEIFLAGDCQSIYEFVVIDSEDPSCQDVFEFDEPLCCGSCEVEISIVEVGDCGTDSFVHVYLLVENDFLGGGYTLRGNGENYGQFDYRDTILVEVKADCSTLYEFIAIDNIDDNCSDDIGLDDVLCCSMSGCEVFINNVDLGDCNDNGFIPVTIRLEANAMASDSFTLRGNGVIYGNYAYSDSPITILLEGDCSTIYELVAIDLEDDNCFDDFEFDQELCCDNGCEVGIVAFDLGDCNADGFIPVVIRVEANNMASDSFFLRGNGIVNGKYAYSDSPVTIELEADCSTIYELIAIDSENENCNDAIDFGDELCCDEGCDFEVDDLFIHDCDGILYDVSFVYEGSSLEDGLIISGDGFDTLLVENNTTYILKGIEGNGDTLTFIINDPENECMDTIMVFNNCSSSVDKQDIFATKLWTSNGQIHIQADYNWWTSIRVHTVMGQKIYSSNKQENIYLLNQKLPSTSILIVTLDNGYTQQNYKVMMH